MVQASRRTKVRGPTFIRLLARLTDVDVPQPGQALSDRLSQWLDWCHAVVLSTALDGDPSAVDADTPVFGNSEEQECARVRTALSHAITGDPDLSGARQRVAHQASAAKGEAPAPIDYSALRQRHVAIQRMMLTATGDLRGRLRDMLAGKTAAMARLAAVDAAMERMLSPREQTLLSAVPNLLGEHFERLRQAAEQTTEETPASVSGNWLDVFRNDMQSVLLAELDVRFQPVEGLLAALRTSPLEPHVQKFS